MRLYKSSEYAIRCLVSMAHGGDDLYSTKCLSESLAIPYKFLGRLMGKLREIGIVEAIQGKGGGYRIAKPLGEICIADIVDAVEGLDNYDRCVLGFDSCDDENPCPMHPYWADHKDAVLKTMKTVTLAQMAASVDRRL
jgi:Rrf2 family iron-sulfur cluster assembly transcriptional regulator